LRTAGGVRGFGGAREGGEEEIPPPSEKLNKTDFHNPLSFLPNKNRKMGTVLIK